MSLTQIAIIMLIALILFGPEDLPVFARALGKMVAKVRWFIKEISKEFQDVIDTPTNIINDVIKEPSKEKKSKTAEPLPSTEKTSQSENDDKSGDGEELLTYEDNSNPLSELPADIVTYPDKASG